MLTGVFLAVVALGLAAAWIFGDDPAPGEVAIGSPAPDFEVRTLDGGDPLVLSEVVSSGGGPVVINLMASWCLPCREEIPELSAFADANPDVVILGIAVEDSYDDFAEFIDEFDPTYPVGFDDGDMRALYQTLGLPATFFLDSDGVIVDVFNGKLDREVLEELVP